MRRTAFILLLLLAGCASGETICATNADCPASEVCIAQRCGPSTTRADGGMDAGLDQGMDSGPSPVDASDPPDLFRPEDGGPPTGPCGEEPCALYRLGPGATTWQAWALGDGTFAPSAPVRAAFDLESEGLAYVLTDASYHVLRLSDRSWIEEGARDSLFPEASGVALRVSYTVPANHVGGDGVNEGVTLESAGTAYLYSMRLADREVTFNDSVTDFGDAWTAPLAPSRAAVLFTWLDVENSRDWAVGDPSAICGAGPTSVGPYFGVVTATDVHLLEAGSCFEFFEQRPTTAFAPFMATGAPSAASVGGAFWNQGSLWLVAE